MANTINAVIIGASGYTGLELIRILSKHPYVEIKYLVADNNAGKEISELYPHLSSLKLPILKTIDKVEFKNIDVVFCCLPHATSQEIILLLPEHVRVIDLSADFRIQNPETYKEWYGVEHKAMDLQKMSIYGLTELNRGNLKYGRIVACPGCYPTSILLPLIPLIKQKVISANNIIADSKSGISGAGRSAKINNLFSEVDGGIKAYSIGGHRHIAEIEQELSIAANQDVTITFTPQIVPMVRGILSTVYVDLNEKKTIKHIEKVLLSAYKGSDFVKVFSNGYCPSTKDVYSTNECRISIFEDRVSNKAIIVSVIDNLVKGASGQAVQNMNYLFDFNENTGLHNIALYP